MSVSYKPGKENGGFEKLSGNKYMAPIAGIAPTLPRQEEFMGTLGIPDKVFDLLEEEGYLLGRARVAKIDDENMGQYVGQPAAIESVEEIEYGVIVPDYTAAPTERYNIHGGNGAYVIEETENVPKRVCITFADADTPQSLDALNYEQVTAGNGVEVYRDLLQN